MSAEIRVSSSLTVLSGNVRYQSPQSTFTVNLDPSVAKGPVPGVVLCSLLGTLIDLSQLTTPGMCRLSNDDNSGTNVYVEVGIYDQTAAVNKFYPLLELEPGESCVVRLSRFLGQEFGTNTSGTALLGSDNRLMIKAVGAAQNVKVEAFARDQ